MKVKTATERAIQGARHGDGAAGRRPAGARDLARSDLAFLGPGGFRQRDGEPLPRRRALGSRMSSHPAMRVNLDACIQCNLCVRACREVQVNDVIGMAYRSHGAKVVFDFDDPMGQSTCVACGECVQACPTGALMPAAYLDENQTRVVYPDREVDSLCPYCGVGCQVSYKVKNEKIVYAEGRDGPANHNRLCVKGRFGFDYVHHPHRLTKPLVRLDNVAEGCQRSGRSRQSLDAFPRSDLGGGAGSRLRRAEGDPRSPRARRRSPDSARPRDRTKRPICSRSWCARASAPTTSITARACAMPHRSRP